MGKYKAIAVIYGSDSSEWEVSCRSGEYVASRIDETAYDIYEIFARFGRWSLVALRKQNSMRVTFAEGARPEVDKTDFSVSIYGEKVKFDFAYIVQHGFPGETGHIQGYLEMLGVPFSSCGAFVSSTVFDKFACKCYVRETGLVQCAPDIFVRKGDDVEEVAAQAARTLSFPVFVKPTSGGSSFGITRVTEASALPEAVRFAFPESPTVIIEQGIPGRELTCPSSKSSRTTPISTTTPSTTVTAVKSAPPRFRTSWRISSAIRRSACMSAWAVPAWSASTTSPERKDCTSWKSIPFPA